jgi:uncharacterized membrane protein YoaK (UPF0700 family)
MAPLLAAVAGFVDVVSYVSLNVFTAHMSGNSARLGVYLGRGAYHGVLIAAFAVGVFVASIVVGTSLMDILVRRRTRAPEATLLVAQAALLLIFAVAGGAGASHGLVPHAPAIRFYGLVACAVTAIGLQTSCLQRVSGQTVRTTYISGMLTTLADEIATIAVARGGPKEQRQPSYLLGELAMPRGGAAGYRIALLAAIWLAYLAGAVGGAFAQRSWQLASLAIPVGILVLVAAASYASADRPVPHGAGS